ncbi:rhamnulokinase family protein [Nocardia sp. BMG111209]|uniref:rhamnulokinase n=1 Tax=Nocardia sp. BMG111209 TaxID=1160137 RepID=UPI000382078F|nr:FGGY-family carbohydrate kinase [Nocardia sp. BMG111209]
MFPARDDAGPVPVHRSRADGNAYAAVDLGAASGRVVRGAITGDRIEMREVHRFANRPMHLPDGLHWNIGGLFEQACLGLAAAGPVRSAGIDSWAVDYGLLDADGRLLGLPYHYRDGRTARPDVPPIDAVELFQRTGVADQPFNTVHQLRAEPRYRLDAARHLLLIPDLLGYWLTGRIGAERTNASTTGLYHVSTRDWDHQLISRLGLPQRLFSPISGPGTRLGAVRAPLADQVGGKYPIVHVASHDTASAVAAVPAHAAGLAYICTGTWSLVGVERPTPLLSVPAREHGFTNEAGVNGIRLLRNVMGLWLLQECMREWPGTNPAELTARAAAVPALTTLIDVDDPRYRAPAETGQPPMTHRIAAGCDGPPPLSPAEYTRCIIDSLAVGHALAIADAAAVTGHGIDTVHLVGGGARNTLLCQATADACGLPLAAGPAEATAMGNLLAQAISDGVLPDWQRARELVAATHPPTRYIPSGDPAWRTAVERVATRR